MNPDQRELLGELLKAIARIERKSQPLLADLSLLDSEAGQSIPAGGLEGRHGLSRCDRPSVLRS